MEARDLALSNARGRMAIGAALVLAPGLAGPMWIGDDGTRPAVKVLARALGVRDHALGLGVAVALDRGTPVRGWLEGAALADAVDLVGTLLAGDSIPNSKRRSVALIAGSSMLVCAALARALDTPPAAHEISVPEAHLTGHP
ncbi:MAG: hypothetical protein QOE60_661 [Thermoleophilaceae bacterium]|nr:hypothetical protein [Thermoleophilaceae bacterium]